MTLQMAVEDPFALGKRRLGWGLARDDREEEPPHPQFMMKIDPIGLARDNWTYWQEEFEYVGPPGSNPLLQDPGDRFFEFCEGYSVTRTVVGRMHDSLRRELRDSPDFDRAIRTGNRKAIDELDEALKGRYGSNNGSSIISVLSKVAAMVRPDAFVAIDRFAVAGVMRLLKLREPESYEEYMRGVDAAWGEPFGERIRHETLAVSPPGLERELRFRLRVLDVCLMFVGGRAI